jgi:hypothetical protein
VLEEALHACALPSRSSSGFRSGERCVSPDTCGPALCPIRHAISMRLRPISPVSRPMSWSRVRNLCGTTFRPVRGGQYFRNASAGAVVSRLRVSRVRHRRDTDGADSDDRGARDSCRLRSQPGRCRDRLRATGSRPDSCRRRRNRSACFRAGERTGCIPVSVRRDRALLGRRGDRHHGGRRAGARTCRVVRARMSAPAAAGARCLFDGLAREAGIHQVDSCRLIPALRAGQIPKGVRVRGRNYLFAMKPTRRQLFGFAMRW